MEMPSAYLGPDDILIVQVGVGAMPPTMAKKYLESVQPGMREVFGVHQKIVFLPIAEQRHVSFAVIHRETYRGM